MTKTVLVTGGAGFIGMHVSKALLERGDKVIVADNFNDYYDPKLKEARIKNLGDKIRLYRIDLSDYKEVEKIFSENKIDKICHLAAQAGVRYSLKDPFRYEKWNNEATLNILEAARRYGVKDYVYSSSSSVYGGNEKIPFSESDEVSKPVSFYAATKRATELYAHVYHHLYAMNCTGLRLFTVYGPWGRPDMALFGFVDNILHDKPIKVFNNGEMERDFTYIADITQGIIAAIDNPFPYEIINLGNSKPVKLLYFIEVIEKELGKRAKKDLLPLEPGDVVKTYADTKKAKELLGYEPKTEIEEGVKEFIDWYKGYFK